MAEDAPLLRFKNQQLGGQVRDATRRARATRASDARGRESDGDGERFAIERERRRD